MPIYEYRCPNGHLFERFQSMSAAAPEKCDVCGAAPVEIVLYPVAVHYKGSGFYSTDYGKKGAAASSSETKTEKSETKTETKSDTKTDSKPAEPKKTSDSST